MSAPDRPPNTRIFVQSLRLTPLVSAPFTVRSFALQELTAAEYNAALVDSWYDSGYIRVHFRKLPPGTYAGQ